MRREAEKVRYLRAAEVARYFGVSHPHVQKLFNLGLITGYRCPLTGDLRIEAQSVIQYAMVNRILIPELGVGPRRVTVIGADMQLDRAMSGIRREGFLTDHRSTIAEFCTKMAIHRGVGIVHLSVGTKPANEIKSAMSAIPGVILACVIGDDIPDSFGTGWWKCWRSPANKGTVTKAVLSTVRGWHEAESW